ncbi:flagella basal body P-ring formation protein FlgA [Planktotalea frisia]|jgi:flagella basal body P-ring formation protein FlgA|uniref:Flagella basal body P-ring formation protein FlgA n=1 Tax=Planktotalea frisia TaxID=696762 RepID=A0A1L9NR46_9RHOB|nr:flagellar basal body P-ring formation chaperone FlgA [Planktotalea frisia]OJI91709.1 flagellar basal body P-ring biosynthesis protein FlgA [Planktotalea frisia]PZX21236.1 flagella basal body P-ring formation protein FlgA [Planktotalea frisia]
MIRAFLFTIFWFAALPVSADIAIATRNIRPGEVLRSVDVLMVRGTADEAFSDPNDVIGTEARTALYAGRTILRNQLTAAASVQRNQIVELVFLNNGLSMSTEGRALARGAVGQRIRVMNLPSKTSIFGTIERNGSVRVSE